jgi:hypothetical protein
MIEDAAKKVQMEQIKDGSSAGPEAPSIVEEIKPTRNQQLTVKLSYR